MFKMALNLVSGLILLLGAGCDMPTNLNSAQAASKTGCDAGVDKGQSPAGLAQVGLCIKSKAKLRTFTVELAQSPQEQAKGLMFRTELADTMGMIFPFDYPRQASFWMKNTVIPLDIIFIRSDGTIENIAENTTPYSTIPVGSTGPVGSVLELRGGLTQEMGIAAGDKVIWKTGQ